MDRATADLELLGEGAGVPTPRPHDAVEHAQQSAETFALPNPPLRVSAFAIRSLFPHDSDHMTSLCHKAVAAK